MKKIITITMLIIGLATAAQTKFEQGMGKAFALWSEGKPVEAAAMFERIAAAAPGQWLPNYDVALINTTTAFQTKEKQTMEALLSKAQAALDVELAKDPVNAELLVMQALIHTAWIVADPMNNAAALSGKVIEIYSTAQTIAPDNPRAVFGKAEFEMGGARYFGNDIQPMCKEVDRAIELFAKFKPETALHPKWGLDRALETQKACKTK